MPTKRKVDLANLLNAIDDAMVKAELLADDNRDIIAGHDGSRVYYDKQKPRIEITSNTFKIILPNMNRAADKDSGTGITAQMQKILDYIDENGQITDQEIQDLLGLKKTRAFTLAKQMRDDGLIKVVGRGSQKVYVVK